LNDWSIDLFIDTLITVVPTTGILSWLMIPYLLLHRGLAGVRGEQVLWLSQVADSKRQQNEYFRWKTFRCSTNL